MLGFSIALSQWIESSPRAPKAAPAGPSVTVSASLEGRALTISVASLSGSPAPSTALTALTVDGVDVRPDATGAGPWSYRALASAQAQTVAWTVTATNAAGEDVASGETVAPADLFSPRIAASSTLTDRTVAISADALEGFPMPDIQLSTLMLDEQNVLNDAVQVSTTWTYTVPSSASAQTISWTVTATNVVGSAVESGSDRVPSDLIAPYFTTQPAILGEVASGETVTVYEGAATGAPAPSLAGVLTLDGADVTGDMLGRDYALQANAGGKTLLWTVTASNGVSPDTTAAASATVLPALAVPVVTAEASATWADDVLTLDFGAARGEPAPTAALTTLTVANAPDALPDPIQIEGNVTRTWTSTPGSTDWSDTSAGEFAVYQSPWGIDAEPGSSMTTQLAFDGNRIALRTFTNDTPNNSWYPLGAPAIIHGYHFNIESPGAHPYQEGGLRGIRTDAIAEFKARARWVDQGTDTDRQWLGALQLYLTENRYQSTAWGNDQTSGGFFYDLQIRSDPAAVFQYPTGGANTAPIVTIDGVQWRFYRDTHNGHGNNTRRWNLTAVEKLETVDINSLIEYCITYEQANHGLGQSHLWCYGIQTWVEPLLGVSDVLNDSFGVRFNGVSYGEPLSSLTDLLGDVTPGGAGGTVPLPQTAEEQTVSGVVKWTNSEGTAASAFEQTVAAAADPA